MKKMRTIKKVLKVQEIQCMVYDRAAKEERQEIFTVPAGESPVIGEGKALLESKVISEKDVVYKMTPDDFFKYATPEEQKAE